MLFYIYIHLCLKIQIVVLLKIYWGDAREKLCESVNNIPLDSLVIGNRGLGQIKRFDTYSLSTQ